MNEQAPPGRCATYQDVLDAPEHVIAEIANGGLHTHPRPSMRHARTSLKLGARLDDPFESGVGGPGGWYFAFKPELHLGADVLVPDLAGWRRENMGAFPDTAATHIAPDWVCEILSPSTRRFDTTEKRTLYGANGVGHLWHVDPQAGTLEAFERQKRLWVLVAALKEGDVVRVPPFDAIGFPLSALWSD